MSPCVYQGNQRHLHLYWRRMGRRVSAVYGCVHGARSVIEIWASVYGVTEIWVCLYEVPCIIGIWNAVCHLTYLEHIENDCHDGTHFVYGVFLFIDIMGKVAIEDN